MSSRAGAPGRMRRGVRELAAGVRGRIRGQDLALSAAGLTFYAGIAVVPILVLAFALTALLTSDATVRQLGDQLAGLLPTELGAGSAVRRLVAAGTGLDLLGGVLAAVPMTFYGEGLRRALLRFGNREESLTGWRGRLAVLPLVVLLPLLLYPLLLAAGVMADLDRSGGVGATLGRIAIGFYAVLFALAVPLG